jgi:hypothetical protein
LADQLKLVTILFQILLNTSPNYKITKEDKVNSGGFGDILTENKTNQILNTNGKILRTTKLTTFLNF